MNWPHRQPRLTPPAKRILFPFAGDSVSRSALDAALRLARAEHATLVPAYIVTVPMRLALEAPAPARCQVAMPLLEEIEQRAARLDVPVDARIETGRTPRHALSQLIEHETYDRLVVPASAHAGDGFSAGDVAWLLEHVPGEVVVLRATPPAAAPDPARRSRGSRPARPAASGAQRHAGPPRGRPGDA
jgi:hypothetical protein